MTGPSLELLRFEAALSPELAARARQELLDRGDSPPDAPFRFGYLLGVEADALADLAAVEELERALREGVVEPSGCATGRRYELSFLKTTVGRAPAAAQGVHFDGFHLDTHPAIRHDGQGIELARLLFNLARTGRAFRYAAIDRFELARRGVAVPRSDYQVVDLPAGVDTRVIEIPPLEAGAVHALAFWASVVPHVGREGPDGHFLASYEAVARPPASAR